ncbi:hypothetical protein BLNAU_1713 [Blattamonas nauphoetae]|uniref:Uncharacterized protein n=1 Tax=Blattamonas nauphoetae TaxID=2049346 RepID=A0ABQ9YHG5_9EUKA|nr:hypothetical protein BLNAU_1713 [Blattamonas nauphoetae]
MKDETQEGDDEQAKIHFNPGLTTQSFGSPTTLSHISPRYRRNFHPFGCNQLSFLKSISCLVVDHVRIYAQLPRVIVLPAEATRTSEGERKEGGGRGASLDVWYHLAGSLEGVGGGREEQVGVRGDWDQV